MSVMRTGWLGLCFGAIWLLSMSGLQAQEIEPQVLENLSRQREQLQQELADLTSRWSDSTTPHGSGYAVNGREVWSDEADVAVYLKAVEWIIRHREFDKKATLKQTQQVLADGEELLRKLQQGQTRSYQQGSQICGYRSQVDESVQPYALTLPADIPLDGSRKKRYPLYVVLHGRGGVNEVGFMARRRQGKPVENQQWIQIDVFGRIDNAYRWAGETDVFEAIKDVSRRFPIDDLRITLWGFSMGGAGAWHLGLHYPDRWASVGAGAGFVDFYGYQNVKEPLPAYQDLPLTIYDAVRYGRNLANLDFVTYGGDQDKQIASSQKLVAEAEKYQVPLKFIIGKEIGHKFTPEAAEEFQAFLWQHNQEGKSRYPGPRNIRFVTYTPKYNECYWLRVEELEEMYQETVVESQYDASTGLMDLETKNVALLAISRDIAEDVSLDGEPPLPLSEAADNLLPHVYFQKQEAGWEVLDYDESRLYQETGSGRKVKDLQGPIDDAFMQPFVCVIGTGTPWSQEHEAWARWTLKRFEGEFDKWMRGKIRIVKDTEVTPEMIEQHHLILFGDPGSNHLIAQVYKELPLEWTAESYQIAESAWPTNEHGVAMISPNPLNRKKYVVLNSGMTTHEKDFKASNAWLFPKLGDMAVIKFQTAKNGFTEEVPWATLLDAYWNLPARE